MNNIGHSDSTLGMLEQAVSLPKQKWPTGTTPLVSISCTVYNQVGYIERCIQGFLSQETTFPVEILIHDDASTDGTTDILRKYEQKFPGLINLTCQVENQFSKGINVNEFNFRKAKGRYVALCHGDDYWTDNLKLEKQVSVIKEMGVSICGHPAREIDFEGTDLNRLTGFQVQSVAKFSPKVLINRNGNMLPFGSIVITEAAKEKMLANMPPVMFHTGIQMLGALDAGIAVMPDVMSAYRTNVPGSTTQIMLGSYSKRLRTARKRVASIKRLKAMYGKDYFDDFDRLLARQATSFLAERKVREAISIIRDSLRDESSHSKFRIVSSFSYFWCKLTAQRIIRIFGSLRKAEC